MPVFLSVIIVLTVDEIVWESDYFGSRFRGTSSQLLQVVITWKLSDWITYLWPVDEFVIGCYDFKNIFYCINYRNDYAGYVTAHQDVLEKGLCHVRCISSGFARTKKVIDFFAKSERKAKKWLLSCGEEKGILSVIVWPSHLTKAINNSVENSFY